MPYPHAMPPPAHWDAADLILLIHAQPGARRTEPAGLHGDTFTLRLSARAVEGAVNGALVEFLAEAFGTLDAIANATVVELQCAEEVGPRVAESVFQ